MNPEQTPQNQEQIQPEQTEQAPKGPETPEELKERIDSQKQQFHGESQQISEKGKKWTAEPKDPDLDPTITANTQRELNILDQEAQSAVKDADTQLDQLTNGGELSDGTAQLLSPKQENLTAEDPLTELTDEQKAVRNVIVDGRRKGYCLDVKMAMDKIFSEDEAKFWDSYIENVVSGKDPSVAEMAKYEDLCIKIGLKDSRTLAREQEDQKEGELNQDQIHSLDTYSSDSLKDQGTLNALFTEKPPLGQAYLYRGVKGEFKLPQMSKEEYDAAYEEVDNLVEKALEDGKLSEAEGMRLKELTDVLKTEGDQYFSDNPDLALKYLGDNGTLVRISVGIDGILQHRKDTGLTAGGYGNNFLVPRGWFAEAKNKTQENSSSQETKKEPESGPTTEPVVNRVEQKQSLNLKTKTPEQVLKVIQENFSSNGPGILHEIYKLYGISKETQPSNLQDSQEITKSKLPFRIDQDNKGEPSITWATHGMSARVSAALKKSPEQYASWLAQNLNQAVKNFNAQSNQQGV